MSINFDEYDSIFRSLNNAQDQPLKQEDDELQLMNMNSMFRNNINNSNNNNYNQQLDFNVDVLQNRDMNKMSGSTYDSFSTTYTPTDSSPEAILFGDNYIKKEQDFQMYNSSNNGSSNMDVEGVLSNEFDFANADVNTFKNTDQYPQFAFDSSLSSPDSFNSSPSSVVAYQPGDLNALSAVTTNATSTAASTVSTMKSKRGRKPLNRVKSESETYDSNNVVVVPAPPVLNKSSSAGNGGVTKPGRKVKSSHNLIEKKYRTNINSKIIELRNCVPALRILISKNYNGSNNENELGEFEDGYEGEGYSDDERKLDGLKPAKKLNKATILSKATEYIRHLEHKVDTLNREVEKLKEVIVNGSGSSDDTLMFSALASSSNSTASSFPQQHSPQSMTNSPPRNSTTNNLIMGGLTCLVGASTFDDFGASNNGNGGNGDYRKGLFSLPILSIGSNQSTIVFKPLFGLLKIAFIFGVLFYMVEPFLKLTDNKKKQSETDSEVIINFEWLSVLRFIHYLTSPREFIDQVVVISENEASRPLLVSTSNLNIRHLLINFIRMGFSKNSVNLLMLKALYLRFISDVLPFLFKFAVLKLSQNYWARSIKLMAKLGQDDVLLLKNYASSDILRNDLVFNEYTNILTNARHPKAEIFSRISSPLEILSKLIIDQQLDKSLKLVIELETLKKKSTPQDSDDVAEKLAKLVSEIDLLVNDSINLSESLPNIQNSKALLLKSLLDPSINNIQDALTLCKLDQYQTNPNALICGLIKLQIGKDDLDVTKLLLLFKKLRLNDMDLISFTSLYSTINVFPKNILKVEKIEIESVDEDLESDSNEDEESNFSDSSISDSSIEYRENHSVEYKLNQIILSILANLRIFLGQKENDIGLSNELKSILIENFVNEINELDC